MDEKVIKTAYSIKLSKETREAFDKALEMHKREGQTAEEAVKTILGLAGARGITPQAEESLPVISQAVEGLVKAINSVLSERELEATDMAKRLEEAVKMKEEFEKTKTELEQTKKVLKKTQEDAEVLKAEKKAMAQKVERSLLKCQFIEVCRDTKRELSN